MWISHVSVHLQRTAWFQWRDSSQRCGSVIVKCVDVFKLVDDVMSVVVAGDLAAVSKQLLSIQWGTLYGAADNRYAYRFPKSLSALSRPVEVKAQSDSRIGSAISYAHGISQPSWG